MIGNPYCVSIVLDRAYGVRLRDLLNDGPVWAVNSVANRKNAELLWSEFPNHDHLTGITVFDSTENRSPEQTLIDEMETIDLHHGVYSADPPFTAIRVVGSSLTPEVRQALESFGFDSFNVKKDGFDAARPLPPPLDG